VAHPGDTIELRAGEASAVVALAGAEPLSWRVRGRELLWHGDPAHWDRSAPILFPVVGASVGGAVLVDGVAYPMPQHGFARDRLFGLVERRPDAVRLRLTDDERTREHYPLAFAFDVTLTLGPDTLTVAFDVSNPGAAALPYALGFHPAFRWPFDDPGNEGHAVLFDAEERAEVPLLTPEGLLARRTRRLAFDGRRLPVTPELFAKGALVFRNAASRSLHFAAPSGTAITLAGDDFPHLALWTKPGAPFLSMEAWTGHADREDAHGELRDRDSMRLLAPGEQARHTATMRFTPRPS
jgi:galactose mutarotase-like enzyme